MIHDVLKTISVALGEYLGSFYDVPEGLAEVGVIGGSEDGTVVNKMVVSLLNIEREGAMGISSPFRGSGAKKVVQSAPAWHLNLYFVVAAVFEEKRYEEALKMLSDSVGFLQRNITLPVKGKQHYAIELVTLDLQQLTNLWSILGGHYYPSVVCKVRMLTYESREIRRSATRSGKMGL